MLWNSPSPPIPTPEFLVTNTYLATVVSRNLALAISALRCWISYCATFRVWAAMATSAVGALALCAPELAASQPCSSCASSRRQWNAGTSIGRRGLVCAVKSRRANCGVRAQVASSPVKNALQYKKLGDSDLVISEVTLGTVRSSSVDFFFVVKISRSSMGTSQASKLVYQICFHVETITFNYINIESMVTKRK